ncbi:MAG TPA: hypothetical protein VGV37_25030 [Aliidongia sp.]|uniref:hypothetical protein n=1 Tax=Aliidongia sp. TaxID=1914230 RepID=UPI002DDCA8BD|nr:hypothetical protein [Aliidongia sp.]HEV2677820.1 hypothetical protein [Aliidongia sp.]
MREYHLYLLDRAGRIKARIDLPCEDDEAALAASRTRIPRGDSELWEGTRLVRAARPLVMEYQSARD